MAIKYVEEEEKEKERRKSNLRLKNKLLDVSIFKSKIRRFSKKIKY